QAGSYTVTVQIVDSDGATASASSTATVSAQVVNDLTAVGQNVTATAGRSFSGTVAMFNDADGSGSQGSYTAYITWGDGQASFGQVVANGNGTFGVVGSHLYSQAGSYTVSVQIWDADGATASATSTAAVANARITSKTVVT